MQATCRGRSAKNGAKKESNTGPSGENTHQQRQRSLASLHWDVVQRVCPELTNHGADQCVGNNSPQQIAA